MQTQALILRVQDIKENDRLVTALTSEYGLVRAFANGAKKTKSPLHGATQPFAHGVLGFTTRRDTYYVNEARTDGVFFDGLAAALSRLALAGYLGAVCAALAPQQEPAPEHLRLMLNMLHFLSTGLRPQLLLKAVTELRLLCLAGYMPNLEGEGGYLDCDAGCLCATPGPLCAALPPAAAEAMRFVCTVPLERAFRFAMPEESLQTLASAAENYLRHQTGRRFAELDFYWRNQA
jgi:DNA repair protein RecO (recombination protein O)